MTRSFLIIATAFLLAGCPGGEGSHDAAQNTPAKTTTSTANPQAVPENATAMNPVIAPEKEMPSRQASAAPAPAVHVQLTEYEVGMPDTLAAGPQQWSILNSGKEQHSLAVTGPGVAGQLRSPLTRGDAATMTLTLKPGTYTVYCPLDGHRGKGMERTITVK